MQVTATRRRWLRRTALSLSLGLAAAGALAQSTTGTVFGTAPTGAGETIHVQSATGLQRDVPVDGQGRFNISALPVGVYTVSLRQGGRTLDSRSDVELRVGTSTNVSFAAAAASGGGVNAKDLSGVQVTANALPAIDVTSVDSRTVVTATQLQKLPIARSAESIALLSPGTVSNAAIGGVSFGGSSVAENAYYINGFNTSDPLSNLGGIGLPYGAIEQEEILQGGYGAQYGRSDGGVISQVGKRGSNEWHFGGQVQWTPRSVHAKTANTYYARGQYQGKLYDYNRHDGYWDYNVNGYFGGPLIKDKLFIFGAYEFERQENSSVASVDSQTKSHTRFDQPRFYGKVDWNITDSNILELTDISQESSVSSYTYNYDYDNLDETTFRSSNAPSKSDSHIYIGKYTGYLTDDLTLSVLYGELHQQNYTAYPGYDPSLNFVNGLTNQRGNSVPVGGIKGAQIYSSTSLPSQGNRTRNLRVDLSDHIGDHTVSVGMDNLDAYAIDQGSATTGPDGFYWNYAYQTSQDNPVNNLGTPALRGYPQPPHRAGDDPDRAYFVQKIRFTTQANVHTAQRAQYIEDAWQISDRFLTKLGLRNDSFTNYNSDGVPYIKQTKPQWAPRLGFAWDVNGDASLKVFGNVGRYYLALPNQVAIRGASGSLNTTENFTYTDVDPATGYPRDPTPLPPGHPVSANNEFGQAPDPATVAVKNIKPEFQDEYILGFEKLLTPKWVLGMRASVRRLRNAIDDVCDAADILKAAQQQGVDTSNLPALKCFLFNPGRANDFVLVDNDGGRHDVRVTNADFGFPHLKRNYAGLDVTMEHPFDGTWYGKFSYTYSHSYGNTEGPVRSDFAQTDISATESWDFPSLMAYSNGDQGNDIRHHLKFNGYYAMTPEWTVGGVADISSGLPKSCLGEYGEDVNAPDGARDPSGYGPGNYYFCNGTPEPPGRAGRLPWLYTFNTSVEYKPAFADHKLALELYVFNILNKQRPTLLTYGYGANGPVPNDDYLRVKARQGSRYFRLTASYDF